MSEALRKAERERKLEKIRGKARSPKAATKRRAMSSAALTTDTSIQPRALDLIEVITGTGLPATPESITGSGDNRRVLWSIHGENPVRAIETNAATIWEEEDFEVFEDALRGLPRGTAGAHRSFDKPRI